MSLKTNTAPKTASLPPLTREVIAIWEKELDDFVGDIQARLETLAVSISQFHEFPTPQVIEIETPSAVLDTVVDAPRIVEPSEQSRPPDQNLTDDRLQAIKQKIAVRLQGESS